MGLVQSFCSRTLSVFLPVRELSAPAFSTHDIFMAVETCDAGVLSRLLDESQFDLTAVDEIDGQTLLHRAITLGRDDMAEMLLRRADCDPRVLNSEDRYGYTPLTRATAMRNVAVMKALVDVGGRTGDGRTLADVPVGDRGELIDVTTVPALILIEAQGDISKAFDIAVEYRRRDAAKLYFGAGASTVSALRGVGDAIAWMFGCGCVRAKDVLEALDHAKQSGDEATVASLTQPRNVLLTLDAVTDRTDAAIAAALMRFIDAGANAEDLLAAAVRRRMLSRSGKDTSVAKMWDRIHGPYYQESDHAWLGHEGPDDQGVIRVLVCLGAPTASEIMHRIVRDYWLVKELISFGADAIGAMRGLLTKNTSRVTEIAYLALKDLFRSRNLPVEEKEAKMKALISEGGQVGAARLACHMVEKNKPLDDVMLLVLAGASPIDGLLEALGRRAYRAEQDQVSTQGRSHSPERQLIRKLISSGGDYHSAVENLRNESKFYEKFDDEQRATVSRSAVPIIMYAVLQDLLGDVHLSNAEKVAKLKRLVSEGAETAADDLFQDAVNAGHSGTVNLMGLAGVAATKAFVRLSKRLVDGDKGAKSDTGRLVRLGADFRPAMVQLMKNVAVRTENGDHEAAQREQAAVHELSSIIASGLAPRGPGNLYGGGPPQQVISKPPSTPDRK